ncbi:MAG TPA: hypothetical protein VFL47_09580, partial [Flavisolibacter sp.]|nr:hypothetical protein [Flavisolibacter sp.]
MKKIITFFSLVFLGSAVLAQDGLADVQAKLAGYTTKLLPEKLYLHTDKNAYVAGEIAWFKIYTVDGIDNRPFQGNKIAYVELLDKENKPVSQLKIALNEKGGNGFIELPFSLSS